MMSKPLVNTVAFGLRWGPPRGFSGWNKRVLFEEAIEGSWKKTSPNFHWQAEAPERIPFTVLNA